MRRRVRSAAAADSFAATRGSMHFPHVFTFSEKGVV
jgi:hypothetical protein